MLKKVHVGDHVVFTKVVQICINDVKGCQSIATIFDRNDKNNPMTTYSIEHAKSGRASCKKCKEKVAKDELRIGVSAPGPGDYEVQSWYHPKCFTLPQKLIKNEGMTADSFVRELLADNTEDSILDDDNMSNDIINAINFSEKKEEKGKQSSGSGQDVASKFVSKVKRYHDSNVDEQPKKKKEGARTKADLQSEQANAFSLYSPLKNDALKDVLRWNQQLVTGNKNQLLYRIIDGCTRGRLGRCPTCVRGRMKLNVEDNEDEAYCNGYFDEESMVRRACFYKCEVEKAPRLLPWFTQEPSEEEKEKMTLSATMPQSAAAAAGGSGDEDKLTTMAQDLTWDLTTPAGIKEAASDMVRLATAAKVDLPVEKARMEIGKLIVSNKSKSALEMLHLVIAQFGIAEEKKLLAKRKHEALTSICNCAANVSVMEAMLELGDLYFKEGNATAGITYKKVAEAIKGLNYEVTEENSKGLGKGKSKVNSIGKGSAEKIYEFVTTGKIDKLEEKRAGV